MSTQLSLTKWINNSVESDEIKKHHLQEVKDRLGLSPFTGKIISLAMYDVERDMGAVYFVDDDAGCSFESDSFSYKSRTEKEILEDFWEGAKSYDNFVTFNGRSFAMPFLYHRSAINEIRSAVCIAKERYLTKQSFPHHIDLLDEFTFYGALHKRPSLQLLCEAYDVEFDSTVKGEDVTELFLQKKFRDIAKRSANDVLAIKSLYEKWRLYLAPQSFINTSEM